MYERFNYRNVAAYQRFLNNFLPFLHYLLLIPSTYLLTYLLSPWSRVLLEKITCFQLVTKFSAFYGARMFITAFTSAGHLSLFWASLIQPRPLNPTSWRSILILSSHLRLLYLLLATQKDFIQFFLHNPCIIFMASCNSLLYLITHLVQDEILRLFAAINAHWRFLWNKCLMMAYIKQKEIA